MILINQPSQSLLWLCQYSGGKLSTVRLLTAAASSGSVIDVQRPAEADEDNLCHSCPKEWRRQDICSDTKEMIKIYRFVWSQKVGQCSRGRHNRIPLKGCEVWSDNVNVSGRIIWQVEWGQTEWIERILMWALKRRNTLCRHWYALYPASTL